MAKAFDTLVRDIQSRLHNIFLRKADYNPGKNALVTAARIPWSWVAVNVAETLSQYPTGITMTVLLSILELKKHCLFIYCFSSIQAVYDSTAAEYFLLEVKTKSWEKSSVTDDSNMRDLDLYMHPKYNRWITYRVECGQQENHSQLLFFKDRKIRMICPPKANSPVINRYEDTTLPRRYRVALIPPTELLLIMLNRNDKEFVLKEFPHKIKHIYDPDLSNNKSFEAGLSLWLKIIHVEVVVHQNPTPNLLLASNDDGRMTKAQRTDLYLIDMSSDCMPVVLSLFDDQTQLASIFKRNDYIGIYRPVMQNQQQQQSDIPSSQPQEVILELGGETVIFLMPEKEAQDANLAKVNLATQIIDESQGTVKTDPKNEITERDEEGFMDCSSYMPRIYVKDLVHRMLNVTLLGKVIGLANNKMDRYALRIADNTGVMDVTLWEDAGRESRKLRLGQYILLDRLVTSDRHKSRNIWYVNGSAVCGTKLYNISTLSSLLSSSSFRSIIPLWHAKETKSDQFQAEGVIIGWKLHLHTNCLLPLKKHHEAHCDFCGVPVQNNHVLVFRPRPTHPKKSGEEWEGWIEWRFDDGTSSCNIYGGEEFLMNITAHHFRNMSQQSQIRLLNSVIGVSIRCTLSGNGASSYRLDQLAFLEPTQQDTTANISSKKMKFAFFTVTGLLTAVSNVAAVTIVTPWAQTVWTAGGHGNITWTTTASDAGLKCDMYLLNGDFKNSNIVAQITDPSTPVDCSIGRYDMHPLNDFASGTYWVRIGQASTGTWSYSSAFQFKGNGTASPVSIAANPSGVAAAGAANAPAPAPTVTTPAKGATNVTPTATPAATKGADVSKPVGAAAASANATSEGYSSNSVNVMALALGAIAAVAVTL
ncbi:hypothetical protein BDF20DRAFT_904391 [Mycotypha africana]|uniref:uncharacterized protein n=1 Tax=Mycotypha africana TaxID=64632 RepID=UPI0023012FBA|nr:uncharacterized protein BDF20DRAFT_904391 [Mycotypha africana]KAI8992086.1 hypothetical protein BDF20DRAFT_904391 [Mycotypha africana]